jgi:hypothetical protein
LPFRFVRFGACSSPAAIPNAPGSRCEPSMKVGPLGGAAGRLSG